MTASSIANRAPQAFQNWTCSDVFRATPLERIAIVKSGLPARWVKIALADFMRGCGRELSVLKLSQAAINRKAALDACLSLRKSEYALGVAGLIGQIETMIQETGAPDGFNASGWFAGWVLSPLPALGGERPIEYLDTWDGRIVISRILTQMQSGAYA